MTCYTENRQYK